MDMLVRNLRILWRTEALLAEHKKNLIFRQMGLLAVAALIAVFGLAMLDLAAFFALRAYMSDAMAALCVGVANAIIAALMIAYAQNIKEGPEMRPAREVRDMAIEDLNAEAARFQAELVSLRADFRSMQQSFHAFVKNPMDAISPGALLPLITTALKALRK